MSAISQAISDECSAIAFYGVEPSPKAAEAFYHAVIQWFNELGHPPHRIGITGPGHSERKVSFDRGIAKLRKKGFMGVTDVELVCDIPGTQSHEPGYLLSAIFNGRNGGLHAHVVARSSLARLSPTSMLPLARTLAQDLKPAYGIGYRRECRFGPDWFAMGINYGVEGVPTGDAREETMNVSRWGYVGIVKQVYREGLLRDVYPWNFLTQPHLVRQISGIPFERWIRQDARRGTLQELCEGVSLWEVAEAEIPDLRVALRQGGVIFNWRTYAG
jgi:hypothetical protein